MAINIFKKGPDRKRTFIVLIILLAFAVIVPGIYCYQDVYGDNYKHKLWLHRTNSLEKMQQFEDKYDNFEVDVVIRENGGLEVTHDHDVSHDIWLKDFFRYVAGKDTRLWIDLKNMNDENYEEALIKLQQMCEEYKIPRGNLIIESKDWENLKYFKNKGFYTSYYVEFKAGELTQKQEPAFNANLLKIEESGYVNAISFYGGNYNYITDNDLDRIDMLIW